ncbi:exo-alpha-sialidase [Leptospira gomenensis]|uniref:Exo-alpha-sialidase n=1 Tax=Leptospira gomenensis TaxID=2484974 RepID=A0A5F1YQP4_9LEPT|nr:sialidase family protein [Leptospira gomenensis]TGK37448.1 exo-alpha-sialidase [Leptospira gomenensis]TGK40807.1 exo-alpha-sialidase [Leptospira gomenensis]TGK43033.1 exo-alpha-sialidase [Leptospira gomenensis]TGK59934.1 exo-alpha-sialidase [Leptospira gomenensis]
MKTKAVLLLVLIQLQCFRFQENLFDPKNPFSLVMSLLGSNFIDGYSGFLSTGDLAGFNQANANTYVSFARRSFGSLGDSSNRIDLIIANETSTEIIPTNVPMIGEQYVRLVGYGYVPSNTTHVYSFLFQVNLYTLDSATAEHYFWSGSSLPTSGSSMNFIKVDPVSPGNAIHSYAPLTAGGAVENAVSCEAPVNGGSVVCYGRSGDFSSPVLIGGVMSSPTSCTKFAQVGPGIAWCYDGTGGGDITFFGSDGTAAAFTQATVDLTTANFGAPPFDQYPSFQNLVVKPDFGESYFVENATDTVRITTGIGDLTSFGSLTLGINGNQQTLSAPGILPSDFINSVRSFHSTSASFVSFISSRDSVELHVPYLFRSVDQGVNWTGIDLTSMPLPSATFTDPLLPVYTSVFGTFVTDSGTEKLHLFTNPSDHLLKRYVSIDGGMTWTEQETITPSSK